MLITLKFKLAAPSAVFETIDTLTIEFWLQYIPNDGHGEFGPFCKYFGKQMSKDLIASCAYRFLKDGPVLCEAPVEMATIRDVQSWLCGSMDSAFVS